MSQIRLTIGYASERFTRLQFFHASAHVSARR